MQIVIDIPRELYEQLMESNADDFDGFIEGELVGFIQNATPLPKGHGRLIDENEIKNLIENAKVNNENSKTFAENIIKFVPTIVGADKESDS